MWRQPELFSSSPSPKPFQTEYRTITTVPHSSDLLIALSVQILPGLTLYSQSGILNLHTSSDIGLAQGMVRLWPLAVLEAKFLPTQLRLDYHLWLQMNASSSTC